MNANPLASVIQPQPFRSDKHEARDLWNCLERLAGWERTRWLKVCCLKASQWSPMPIDVVRCDGQTDSVITLFYSICGQNGLTLEWATAFAEELHRRRNLADFTAELLKRG